MKRIKTALAVAVLAFAVLAGWRVGSSEMANLELQEDLNDMASQKSFRFGNTPSKSEDELREAVIRKAGEYDIHLAPEQVTVRTSPTYLAADYSVPVNLPRLSFTLHFTPSSEKASF